LGRVFFWVPFGATALLTAAACGSSDSSTFNDNPGDEAGSGDDGGGLFGESGTFGGDGSVPFDADPDAFTACAADTQQATQLPLDLYLMIDTSGSMAELVAASSSKWAAVKAALTSFVQDPGSAGIGAGMQFFPVPKAGTPASCTTSAQCGASGPCLMNLCIAPGLNQLVACTTRNDCPPGGQCVPAGVCANEQNIYCPSIGQACGTDGSGFNAGTCQSQASSYCINGDSCTATDYAAPAAAIAALPGAAAAITSALGAKQPAGETPTSAALTGAISAAKTYAGANTGHSVVVVLATDGLPTECDTNIANVANLAQTAAAGNPSVKTFVIGVFAQAEAAQAQSNLDKIAAAGGTSKAFVVQTNQNVTQQFLGALNQIRGTALPCEYTLPVPKSGTPDYNKVNVEYTNAAGQQVVLPYVKSAANCGANGGWYYDVDPATGGKPTKIIVCSNTCDTLKAAGQGSKVQVVQGCQTVTGGIK
jgi:hypothetical protein